MNSFGKNDNKAKISNIEIGTEELTEEGGRTRAVSTMEITLSLEE